MMPHPTIEHVSRATGRALIVHGEHLSSWMSVDDVYDQMFAWFDLARELRRRNLAVEAVERDECVPQLLPEECYVDMRLWPWSKRMKRGGQ